MSDKLLVTIIFEYTARSGVLQRTFLKFFWNTLSVSKNSVSWKNTSNTFFPSERFSKFPTFQNILFVP